MEEWRRWPAALRLVSEPSVIVQVSLAKDRCCSTALAGLQGVRTCRAGNWGRTLAMLHTESWKRGAGPGVDSGDQLGSIIVGSCKSISD